MINRVPEKLWTKACDSLETVFKIIPKKRKCKKANWLPEEALHTADERRGQKAREKEKDISN